MFGHHGWWMQPISKLEYESGLTRYMGKWDTRVAGPWSDMSPPMMKTSGIQLLEQQAHSLTSTDIGKTTCFNCAVHNSVHEIYITLE